MNPTVQYKTKGQTFTWQEFNNILDSIKSKQDAGAGGGGETYSSAEKTKLAGIQEGATANNTNAYLLDRANHTGTQSSDTLTEGSTNRFYTDARVQSYVSTRYVSLTGSYTNPSWIASLNWTKISGKPTTISGFGITDYNSLGDARWLQLAGGVLIGDVEISTSGKGLILKDTGDASRRRITCVNGVLTVSAAL